MVYKTKATVCSETRTKRSTQSQHQVEILNLFLAVRKETAML